MAVRSNLLLVLLALAFALIVGITVGSLFFVARTAGGAVVPVVGSASAPNSEDGKRPSAAQLSDLEWRVHLEARIDQLESRIQELSQSPTPAPRERVSVALPEQPSPSSFVEQHRAEILQLIEEDRQARQLDDHLSKLRTLIAGQAGDRLTADQLREAQSIFEDFERQAEAILKSTPSPKDTGDPRWSTWAHTWDTLRERRLRSLSKQLGSDEASELVDAVQQFQVSKF